MDRGSVGNPTEKRPPLLNERTRMQACRYCEAPIRFVKVRTKKYPCVREPVAFSNVGDAGQLYGLIALTAEQLPFVVSQYTSLGELRDATLVRVHSCPAHKTKANASVS